MLRKGNGENTIIYKKPCSIPYDFMLGVLVILTFIIFCIGLYHVENYINDLSRNDQVFGPITTTPMPSGPSPATDRTIMPPSEQPPMNEFTTFGPPTTEIPESTETSTPPEGTTSQERKLKVIIVSYVLAPPLAGPTYTNNLKAKLRRMYSELISNDTEMLFIGQDSSCVIYGPFSKEEADDVLNSLETVARSAELPNLSSNCIPKGGIRIAITPHCKTYGENAELCLKRISTFERSHQFSINIMSTVEELKKLIQKVKKLLE
uniref:Uncharacterized protein n=1 Tax=Panagrolaimus sp. JU765 TaxID=591449 RepID=A0AC34R0R7_9BILA